MSRSIKGTIKTVIVASGNDREYPVFVDYSHTPAFAGTWYRANGDPGDPPEPEETEVLAVRCNDVDILVNLTEAEIEALEGECAEDARERIADHAEQRSQS